MLIMKLQVANAVGAAFSQIGGSVDEFMPTSGSWDELISAARTKAKQIAVCNGALADTVEVFVVSSHFMRIKPCTSI